MDATCCVNRQDVEVRVRHLAGHYERASDLNAPEGGITSSEQAHREADPAHQPRAVDLRPVKADRACTIGNRLQSWKVRQKGVLMNRYWRCVALIAICVSTTGVAGDRDEYNRRSAERFIEMFRSADVNRDDVVSREEATGTIELVARFDDVDDNRDGNIDWNELTRFLDATFR